MQGVKKAKPQKAEILPKCFSQKWGNARGIMAIESSMHTKGIAQRTESCAPGILGCPSPARTTPGTRSAAHRAPSTVRNLAICTPEKISITYHRILGVSIPNLPKKYNQYIYTMPSTIINHNNATIIVALLHLTK